jgi:hypothetical protein
VSLHNYSHVFKTAEDEAIQIEAELEAFESYGLLNTPIGANQHTWFTSTGAPAQTLKTQMEHGILWNFGYQPSNSPASPAERTEYELVTPFYLHGADTKMLLYNANFDAGAGEFKMSARYDLPITMYKHSEYAMMRDTRPLEWFLYTVGVFQNEHLYNFVTERQFAASIAAAMDPEVKVYARLFDLFADWLRGLMGKDARFDRYLVAQCADADAPLHDERYEAAVGVRVELGDKARWVLATDAKVMHSDTDTKLMIGDTDGVDNKRWDMAYISLAGAGKTGTHIWTSHESLDPPQRLIAVNLPATITEGEDGVTVAFLDDGLQQAFYYSEVELRTSDDTFKVESLGGYIYKFSFSGERSTLTIG